MLFMIFLAPLMYWYITIPEILYIIHAMIRSAATNGEPMFYGVGLAVYYVAFISNQKGTIAVTAVLILIDFLLHRQVTATSTEYYVPSTKSTWDPLDPTDPYNDCPDCGSGDTDGNHCYDCDEDF